jgi:hypothetical protein
MNETNLDFPARKGKEIFLNYLFNNIYIVSEIGAK